MLIADTRKPPMRTWTFRKREPSTQRGLCVVCDSREQKPKANGKFHPYCGNCQKKLYGKGRPRRGKGEKRIIIPHYKTYKKDHCEECGFIPKHSCQLDVDHIDQNHKNNAPENLQTLCANCHRLKTYLERQ